MPELGLILLVNHANAGLARSALPDSPVVLPRPPGRVRLGVAAALHRVARRLDGEARHSGTGARAALSRPA